MTVFSGPIAEAVLLRSALAARGIEGFIPGEHTKVSYPFITGANSLDVSLEVPEADAEDAIALLRELGEEGGGLAEPGEEAPSRTRRLWLVLVLLLFIPSALVFLSKWLD